MTPNTICTAICTMNRPVDLQRAIESILDGEVVPTIVIVSDDSREDDHRTRLLCGSYPGVHYQRGPRAGLSANRNACIATCFSTAKAVWIHFVDDDVVVPPQFYRNATNVLTTMDARTIVSGIERRTVDAGAPTLVFPPQLSFWGFLKPAYTALPDCVVINSAVFPLNLFHKVRFDIRFKYGCEEIDISQAALHQGYKLHVATDLVVDHYPSPVNRSTYASSQIASQVYSGLKQQWCYRESWLGTIAFACLGVPRIILFCLRRDRVKGLLESVRQSVQGIGHFVGMAIQDREKEEAEWSVS